MSLDLLSRQVLIHGRITDRITDSRPRSLPGVSVRRDADGRPVEFLDVRVVPEGFYAIHGDPSRMVPPQTVDLRIEVTAAGYQAASVVLPFTTAQLARTPRSLTIGGETVLAEVIGAAPRLADVALDPEPVTLKGRVRAAEDPVVAIAGAEIAVTAPSALGPVVSGATGFFTIGPLPVAARVTLSITAAGRRPSAPVFRPDYANPINAGGFALVPV